MEIIERQDNLNHEFALVYVQLAKLAPQSIQKPLNFRLFELNITLRKQFNTKTVPVSPKYALKVEDCISSPCTELRNKKDNNRAYILTPLLRPSNPVVLRKTSKSVENSRNNSRDSSKERKHPKIQLKTISDDININFNEANQPDYFNNMQLNTFSAKIVESNIIDGSNDLNKIKMDNFICKTPLNAETVHSIETDFYKRSIDPKDSTHMSNQQTSEKNDITKILSDLKLVLQTKKIRESIEAESLATELNKVQSYNFISICDQINVNPSISHYAEDPFSKLT